MNYSPEELFSDGEPLIQKYHGNCKALFLRGSYIYQLNPMGKSSGPGKVEAAEENAFQKPGIADPQPILLQQF